ncbi:uncharacterized protein PAC_01499 [Phialocephala subalpina]|uniref:Uncharacterized protein n=1 Tax=Phialocephala subalpina TaxID=576137 RepID=A0A1L7WFS5_9HELO|nr:uncharacterized protein PAC_01499 [Phialocephala subalpina]
MVQKDTMSMTMPMTTETPAPTHTTSSPGADNTSMPHDTTVTSLAAPTITSSLPLAPTSTSRSTILTKTTSSTSVLSTFTSSTTSPPVSTSTVLSTTTLPPTTSIPASTSTLSTTTSSTSPPQNTTITIVHAPPTNHTAAIVGISVGSSITLILALSILFTWYRHIRSRNKARREEELEIATDPQGTFVGGFKLAQLKSLGTSSGDEQKIEKEVAEVKGLRRSNTREDGRRNGIVLRSMGQLPPHPTPSETQIHNPPERQAEPNPATQEGGQLARARFDAWKRARGIPTADELYQLQTHSQAKLLARAQEPRKEENIENIATGVKRSRTTIDAWKTGEVPRRTGSIPTVMVTAATPIVGNYGKGKGKGPATFEDMGLKRKRKGKGLGVDLKEMEGVLAPPRVAGSNELAWWEKK